MVAIAPVQRRVLTLLIDNYDSYTFNIFQMLAEVNGVAPVVVKNDDFGGDWRAAWTHFQLQAQQIKAQYEAAPAATAHGPLELVFNVVISPGPGHPAVPGDFGMCADAIRGCNEETPLFGVCLGHQGLALAYGGSVVNAPEVMHGRMSRMLLDTSAPSGLFEHVPDGFEVVRYHSLTVDPLSVPDELHVTARTEDGVIMALEHREKPQYGVQFHPEAVCSSFGYQLFQNFRDLSLGVATSKCLLEHGDRSPSESLADQVSAVPTLVQAKSTAKYTVLINRVATGCASLDLAQRVFKAFFGESRRSFWLDSSSYVDPANDTSSDSGVQGRQVSRFSFMGDDSGPLSHCIEYSVLQKQLRVHRAEEETQISDEADALARLRGYLSEFQSHETQRIDEPSAAPFSFRGGYVGYLGYEMVGNGLDDNRDASATVLRDHLQQKQQQGEYVPDLSLLFADRVIIFDHLDACIYTLSVSPAKPCDHEAAKTWHAQIATRLLAVASSDPPPPRVRTPLSHQDAVVFYPSRSRDQYVQDIADVQQQIHDGETYEVCVTNQLRASVAIRDPLAFYEVLRQRNPAPYAAFYMSNPDGHFHHHASSMSTTSPTTDAADMLRSYAVCCSSPERFLRVEQDGWMESKPIKGTRRRGQTPSEDREIINELASCYKDRAENMMIADLVRNDFGRVAQIGSVYVPKLMTVESYATVHQLVTTVRAKRSAQADIVDVIAATFPGGSMTGAPKKRTMQLIRSLEKHPRGVYSGALGFFSLDGSCDLNIIIRTALITTNSVSLGSGGAIIALSECNDEYEEMLLKTKALVQSVGAFVTGREDGSGARVAVTTSNVETPASSQ